MNNFNENYLTEQQNKKQIEIDKLREYKKTIDECAMSIKNLNKLIGDIRSDVLELDKDQQIVLASTLKELIETKRNELEWDYEFKLEMAID